MPDVPVQVEPIDEPIAVTAPQPADPTPIADGSERSDTGGGLLSYRTIRWISCIGIAPRWIDLLLLLLTTGLLFVAGSALVGLLMAKGWPARFLALAVAAVSGGLVFLLWWWSNHFRHRKIDDGDLPDNPAKPSPTAEQNLSMNV